VNQENNNYNFDPMTGQPINSQQNVQQSPVVESLENKINLFQDKETHNKPRNKKKIILIIVGILIIFLGVILFFYLKDNFFGNNEINLKYVFDPDKPIVIKDGEEYGYITSDGEELIEPKFIYAGSFYGDYAVVKVDNPDDDDTYFTEIYQIIDRKGNMQLEEPSYTEPTYISECDRWIINSELYNNKLDKVLDNDVIVSYIKDGYFSFNNFVTSTSGIIDKNGKEKFTWEGTLTDVDITENPIDNNTYAKLSDYGEREVIINLKNGKVVYTLENPERYYMYATEDGIFEITDRDDYSISKYIYIEDNKLAYEAEVENLSFYDYENKILKLDYGYDYDNWDYNYKYYDLKNKKMLEEEPSKSESEDDDELNIMENTYGFKTYSCEYKYGLKKDEESILPCQYNDIEMLNYNLYSYMKSEHNKELVLLEKEEKTILYDLKEGKGIKTFDSDYVYDTENSTFLKINTYDENYKTISTIYNILTGESKTFNVDDKINIYSNYIVIEKDEKDFYYNTKLEKIYEIEK